MTTGKDPRGSNQGEGDRESARRYNKDVRETIRTTDIEQKAEQARQAVDSDKSGRLKKAEDIGKSKARS
jgi:hypothetical protein